MKLIPGLFLFALLTNCAPIDPASNSPQPSAKHPILRAHLEDSYTATHDPTTDEISITMDWMARFGQIIETTTLNNLDLGKIDIDEVPGGAFKYTYSVEIPARSRQSVTVQSWPPSPDDELANSPESTSKSDYVSFHCNDLESANAAIAELKKLQGQ